MAADLTHAFQQFRKICARPESTFRSTLDDRTVGNGIGEGNAQFDQIGSAPFQSQN